jgi:putative flippase GtrA
MERSGGLVRMTEDGEPSRGIKAWVYALDARYGVLRLAKFAMASGTGFVVAEALLALGVYAIYHRLIAPSDAYSSPAFVGLDVAALVIGVAVSFFLNERYTVDARQVGAGRRLPVRLLMFEGVNGLGNITIIVVQYLLLTVLSLTPVLGNIVGAIVSYPVTYLISMHFVWKSSATGQKRRGAAARPREEPQKRTAPPVAAAAVLAALYALTHLRRKR